MGKEHPCLHVPMEREPWGAGSSMALGLVLPDFLKSLPMLSIPRWEFLTLGCMG